MNSLVYHAGALGDFLTTLPAIRAWRRTRPEGSRVILLGRPEFGAIALHWGIIEEVWDVNRADVASLFGGTGNSGIRRMFASISSALLFTEDNSPVIRACRGTGIADLAHQPPFPSGRRPIVEYHLDALPRTVRSAYAAPPPAPWKSHDTTNKNGTVALAPGSGSPRKNWPFPRFEALADSLRKKGRRILWIAGPAEPDLRFPPGDRALHHAALPTLASALSGCDLYVGNDSGVSHLAAMLGIPVIALFGPSDASVWRPAGLNVTVLEAAPPCAPCHGPGIPPRECPHPCMADLSAESVSLACMERLCDNEE